MSLSGNPFSKIPNQILLGCTYLDDLPPSCTPNGPSHTIRPEAHPSRPATAIHMRTSLWLGFPCTSHAASIIAATALRVSEQAL